MTANYFYMTLCYRRFMSMELSPKYYYYFVRPKWFSNIFFNKMLKDYFDFKDKEVLDFGCGIGSSSFLFQPSTYIGVDCDNKRIEYANKLYPEYKFMTVKEGRLDISTNSIDYIIILSVLHHIPSEALSGYLMEFKRIMKPAGRIIIVEPCLCRKQIISNWYMTNFDKGKYIRSEEEYLNIFNINNFKTEVIKRYNQLLFYNKIMFSAYPNK
jgi:ubiquinone/menaquinone biosynthesis C-methylase UbiE